MLNIVFGELLLSTRLGVKAIHQTHHLTFNTHIKHVR